MSCGYHVIVSDEDYLLETIEIKRSRFLAYARRVDNESQARDFLSFLRSTHRQARHICHGFVCGHQREIQRSSDDGEPAGTAGIPILCAITERQFDDGYQLSQTIVAVVRYFGGIKLGASNLLQTYSHAATAVLNSAHYGIIRPSYRLTISLDYAAGLSVENLLRAHHYHIETIDYTDDHIDITVAIGVEPCEYERVEQLVSASLGRAATMQRSETISWIEA